MRPHSLAHCGRVEYNGGTVLKTVTLRFIAFLLVVAMAVTFLPGTDRLSLVQAGGERLVLAFYYAWYDQKSWQSGKVPDVPLTPYASANPDAMARQIDQAMGAGIDAFVLNWWGKGNPTEKNLRALLDIAAQKGFRVAVDFDLNSPTMQGVDSYADNLRHLHAVHAAHSAYLRYQGRAVVFFYNVSRLPVTTWKKLRDQADPDRKALWIAEGTNLAYQAVFDGHHLYSITWPNRISPSQTLPQWGERVRKYNREHGTSKVWVATVMPGYDDRKARPGSGFARSREEGAYYRQSWQAAIASKPHWVIINSWNEWPEGSYIEPSQAYGQLYLELTREWAARFKSADLTIKKAPLPAPTRTASPPTPSPLPPTPTPTPTVYLVDDGQMTARGIQERQGCRHLFENLNAERTWLILCPLGLTAELLPPIAY